MGHPPFPLVFAYLLKPRENMNNKKYSLRRNIFLRRLAEAVSTLLFICTPMAVFATSGACSSHGGVNCVSGPNLDGNVVCNDGWVNSSVSFSDTEECKDILQCPYYVSNYDSQRLIYEKAIAGEKKSQQDCSLYTTKGEVLNQQSYQSCIDLMNAYMKLGNFDQAINLQCASKGYEGSLSNISKQQTCIDQSNENLIKLQRLLDCMHPDSESPFEKDKSCIRNDHNSRYNLQLKKCACEEGYTMIHNDDGSQSCLDHEGVKRVMQEVADKIKNEDTQVVLVPVIKKADEEIQTYPKSLTQIKRIYEKNQELIKAGKQDEADANYDALSEEDTKIYDSIKKETRNNDMRRILSVDGEHGLFGSATTSQPQGNSIATETIATQTLNIMPAQTSISPLDKYMNWTHKVSMKLWGLFMGFL